MTVKEILEKTEFGSKVGSKDIIPIIDYNTTTLFTKELLLEEYKKAFRKNAAYRHREIKALLDLDAAVVEDNFNNFKDYSIITRRSFEGPFSKPLKDREKIIFE